MAGFSPTSQAEGLVGFPLAVPARLVSLGGGNALYLFEKAQKVPLAKDLMKHALFTIAKWSNISL